MTDPDGQEREALAELVELEDTFSPIYPPETDLKWQAAWSKARATLAAREEPPEGELRSLDDPCSECGAEPGDPCQARPGESQITPHRVAVREEPASACVCGHDLKQHRAEYGTDCAVCGCRAFSKREDTERPDELVDFPEETLVALKELIYPLEDLPSSDRLLRMVEKALETKRRAA